MIRDLLRVGLAALAGTALVIGYTSWRIRDQGARDEQRPAGAIVVMGAAQYGGRPSPVFTARLDHAVALQGREARAARRRLNAGPAGAET